MAVSGFSLLLAAVSALTVLAALALPVAADEPRALATPAADLAEVAPAEAPPPDFTGGQYIDSAGCVFLRTPQGWRARATREGEPICGYPPTFSARRTAPDTAVNLFPPAPEPEPERIQRELTERIIPNLQGGELAEGGGERPGTLESQKVDAIAETSRGQASDPLHLGAIMAGAPALSREMGGDRMERVCALIGGTGQDATEPALGLCGTRPAPLATLNRSKPVQTAVAAATSAPAVSGHPVGRAEGRRPDKPRAGAPGGTPSRAVAAVRAVKRADDPRLIPPGSRYVQVGSDRDPRSQGDVAQKLAALGLPVVRARQEAGKPPLVLVGPLEGREAVVRMIDLLRRAGYADLRARP